MGVGSWDKLLCSERIALLEAKNVVEVRYLDHCVWAGLDYDQLPPEVRRKLEEVPSGQADR